MSKVLVFDVNKGFYEASADKVKEFYDLLSYKNNTVNCYDSVRRPIGGIEYDILVDDNGLLKSAIVPSAAYAGMTLLDAVETGSLLVGNMVFTRNDEFGEAVDLTHKDIVNIKAHVQRFEHEITGESINLVLFDPVMAIQRCKKCGKKYLIPTVQPNITDNLCPTCYWEKYERYCRDI